MLYRILTEDKNRAGIESLVAKVASGFTLYPGIGYWKGVRESSLAIEIAAPAKFEAKARTLCADIRKLNKQEAVGLQVIRNKFNLI